MRTGRGGGAGVQGLVGLGAGGGGVGVYPGRVLEQLPLAAVWMMIMVFAPRSRYEN